MDAAEEEKRLWLMRSQGWSIQSSSDNATETNVVSLLRDIENGALPDAQNVFGTSITALHNLSVFFVR